MRGDTGKVRTDNTLQFKKGKDHTDHTFGRAILTALLRVKMSQRPSDAMITRHPCSGMRTWRKLIGG